MQTFDIIKHYKHIKQIGHLIQPQQTQNLCFKAEKKHNQVVVKQRTNQSCLLMKENLL